MDRLFAPRPDSAVVFIPGRRRVAVFDGEPGRARAITDEDGVSRGLAGAGSGVARSLSPVGRQIGDELDVRGYPFANRDGLRFSFSARLPAAARPVGGAGAGSGGLLGGVRDVSVGGAGL